LIASGMTLVFGIMGIINLAHGSFYMVGAYLAYWVTSLTDNLLWGILLALPLLFLIGFLIEKLAISFLYHRDHLSQVLLTYGLILILSSLQIIFWGKEFHGIDIPSPLNGSIALTDHQNYPVYRLFISFICGLTAFGMYFVIQKTRLGMKIRAGSSNREMLRILGIDVNKLYSIVFSVGIVLAGFAGMLVFPLNAVYPGMEENILIMSFVVITLGGIGSIRGAFLSAMMIGILETFGGVFFPEISSFLVFGLMALVLMWRPQGLFGQFR